MNPTRRQFFKQSAACVAAAVVAPSVLAGGGDEPHWKKYAVTDPIIGNRAKRIYFAGQWYDREALLNYLTPAGCCYCPRD